MAKRNLRQRIEEKVFKSRTGVEYSSGASQIRHATAGGRARMLSGRATAALAALAMMATTAITPLIMSANDASADEPTTPGSICQPSDLSLGDKTNVSETDYGVATWVGQNMYVGANTANLPEISSNSRAIDGSYAVEAEGLTLVNGKLVTRGIKNSWPAAGYGFRWGTVGYGSQYRPGDDSDVLVVNGSTGANWGITLKDHEGHDVNALGYSQWDYHNDGQGLSWVGKMGDDNYNYNFRITGNVSYGLGGNDSRRSVHIANNESDRTRGIYTNESYNNSAVGYQQGYSALSKVTLNGHGGIDYTGYQGEVDNMSSVLVSAGSSTTGTVSTSTIAAGSVHRYKYDFSSTDNEGDDVSANVVTGAEKLITFTGDGTSNLQVFNLNPSLLSDEGYTGVSFYFTNIPDGASVVVNVMDADNRTPNTIDFHNGWHFYWGEDSNNNRRDISEYFAKEKGETNNKLYSKAAQSIMWNFPDTTELTIRGGQSSGSTVWVNTDKTYNNVNVTDDPSAMMLGSIMVPNGSFESHVSTNGRVYVGGDFSMYNPTAVSNSATMFGEASASIIDMDQERHNLPWSADVQTDCPTISWEKTDASGNLRGDDTIGYASFQVFGTLADARAGNAALVTVTDNGLYDQDSTAGKIKVQNLGASATYFIKEVGAPKGYSASSYIYQINTGSTTTDDYYRMVAVYDSSSELTETSDAIYFNNASGTYGIINYPEGADVAWAKYDVNDTSDTKTALEGSSWVLNDGTNDYLVTDNATPVGSVAIYRDTTDMTGRSSTLMTGDSITYTALVLPRDANPKVKWESSDPSMVAVNDGVVTVLRNFTDSASRRVTITATSEDDNTKSASTTIICRDAIANSLDVRYNGASVSTLSLEKGATAQLTAVIDPTNLGVTWTSNDESVATVDSTGKVTAKKTGTTIITATGGDLSHTVTVTVTNTKTATIYFSTDADGWSSSGAVPYIHYGINNSNWISNPVKMTHLCDSWYYYEIETNGASVTFNFHKNTSASSSAYQGEGSKNFVMPSNTFEWSVASYQSASSYKGTPNCSASTNVAATTEGDISSAVYVTDNDDEVLLTSGIKWSQSSTSLPTDEKTDADGRAGYFKLTGLPDGTYTLLEATAPEGFTLNRTEFSFKIEHGAVEWLTNITVDNGVAWIPDTPTEVRWEKIDGTSTLPLDGTSWDIYDSTTDEVLATIEDCIDTCDTASVDNWKVDTDMGGGVFSVKYIPVGTYYLKERSVPQGYTLNTSRFDFEIKASDTEAVQVTGSGLNGKIVNDRILGQVEWKKVSSEDSSATLTGSTWTLEYTSDVTGQTTTTTIVDCAGQSGCLTDEAQRGSLTGGGTVSFAFDGVFSFAQLGWGSYKLTETKAPDGYNLDATPYEFEINAQNSSEKYTFEVENEPGVVLPSAGTDQTARMVVILGAILTAVALLGISLLSRRAE